MKWAEVLPISQNGQFHELGITSTVYIYISIHVHFCPNESSVDLNIGKRPLKLLFGQCFHLHTLTCIFQFADSLQMNRIPVCLRVLKYTALGVYMTET